MRPLYNYVIALLMAALFAGCAPVNSQMPAPAASTAEATAAGTEAPTEATAAPAAEVTMDHSKMDHGAMNHGAMGDEPFDAQFIDGMIAHHEGAIAMANQVLAESQRPELRQMAEAILATQQAEVDQMRSWRDQWYPDLPATKGMDMDMGAMEIRADPTKPFEHRFLEAMISHHEGAVSMAQAALENSEHPEIRSLAEAIIAAQEGEIEQMRGWLKQWFGVEYATE